jgi:hypothetical protein
MMSGVREKNWRAEAELAVFGRPPRDSKAAFSFYFIMQVLIKTIGVP